MLYQLVRWARTQTSGESGTAADPSVRPGLLPGSWLRPARGRPDEGGYRGNDFFMIQASGHQN